jgi:FAD:protein FMN transferase
MYEVILLARRYFLETDGLFDPAVLPDLERAGYDRSIEQVQAAGGLRTLQPAPTLTRPSFGEVELAEDRLAVRLPAGLRMDLGGIAKGWIAEQAAHLLHRYASACAVNAGGDQVSLGLPLGQKFWEVGLEDPFHPEQDLTVLRVGPGAVATSSVIRRRWHAPMGSRQMHHLIDPRTGEPARSSWASVTVITQSAAAAEVLAKVLLIAGAHGADAILARHDTSTFIVVDLQGNLWASDSSKETIHGTY